MAVWELPSPLPGSGHHYKYRLAYVERGERVIGYDNERGKGDHQHIGKREQAYAFVDVPTLLADFLDEVKARRQQ